MKLFILTILLLNLSSCAFNAEEEKASISSLSRIVERGVGDTDGDNVTDLVEIESGRNPLVADLPKFKSRFLQNYRIELTKFTRNDEERISIDTSIHQGNPDFKYRVGKIFARENAFDAAARVGKFSSHSSGAIENRDLTWIKFPEIDRKLFLQDSLELKSLFDDEDAYITAKVTVENSLKLKENDLFKEIKNLEVSFYYYNYQSENYELLGAHLVDRHFKAGVNETFSIPLEYVPVELIRDNYLSKGEFIISEITDFEIPELDTTYKRLISSVKAKTIPVIFNTPLESQTIYVATPESGMSFIGVMDSVFKNNVDVSEDILTRVGQFSNNLGDYTYLKELKDKDKLGKWFVFTRALNVPYLNHRFRRGEPIVVSWFRWQQNPPHKLQIVAQKSSSPFSILKL